MRFALPDPLHACAALPGARCRGHSTPDESMTSDAGKPPLLRPTQEDLRRVAAEVAEVSEIQQHLRDRHPHIKCPDRAAHQYQITGGTVLLRMAETLPPQLAGVGLFLPGAEHFGVGRISTSLGIPHPETTPDFLGIRASFLAANGQQVDFFGVSSSAVPVDAHGDSMDFLRATAAIAGPVPIVDNPMTAGNILVRESLFKHMGKARAEKLLARVATNNARAARFSTAFQPFWTGIVELSGTLGKFTLRPVDAGNGFRALHPGEHFLTREWERRQAAGDIVYAMHWIAFLDEQQTPLDRFAQPWVENHAAFVGQLIFPRADLRSDESRLWATLAAEMDSNPGNWIDDASGVMHEPSTEFGLVRKLAYELSTQGRHALRLNTYREALARRQLDAGLAEELRRRMTGKRRAGHIDRAPP